MKSTETKRGVLNHNKDSKIPSVPMQYVITSSSNCTVGILSTVISYTITPLSTSVSIV